MTQIGVRACVRTSRSRGGSGRAGAHSQHDRYWHSRSAANGTCKHQKQNGHTWGWRLARGALATWMSGPGRAGARRGRGQPAWLRPRAPARARPARARPAPLSWALISPGRAIQLRAVRCISPRPARSRGLFITTSPSRIPLLLFDPDATSAPDLNNDYSDSSLPGTRNKIYTKRLLSERGTTQFCVYLHRLRWAAASKFVKTPRTCSVINQTRVSPGHECGGCLGCSTFINSLGNSVHVDIGQDDKNDKKKQSEYFKFFFQSQNIISLISFHL